MECILPTFDVLSEEQIKKINDNSYLVSHKKEEVIFRQNTPISYIQFVKSGLIKIFKESDTEKTVIIKILSYDSFLGIVSVFHDTRYHYSASALEDSKIIYVNLATFKEVIEENGKYAIHLLKLMSNDIDQLLAKVINVSQKQVTGRLAEVLLYFSRTIYKSQSYTLPLSRIELSELISTTKESISRTLIEFKNDKIIDIDDKRIEIKSPDLLQILSRLG